MPEVIRGSARVNSSGPDSQPASPIAASPGHVPSDPRRITFDRNGQPTSTESIPHVRSSFALRRLHDRRRSSNHHLNGDLEGQESEAYYDSRAATHREFGRRGSTLQSYYIEHPDLLPQLPFTFRHGFKRWKLFGYIGLMVFDACVVPIVLYYALTNGGNVQGWITFAVITAIWGGPSYIEFAVRSLRLIKKEHFYKPLGANQRLVFDITNWIFAFTIACVTALLIVGAAPHIVFLRVLSMPGPAILFCLCGPMFLISCHSARGGRAPFRISSTAKGEVVLPAIYYIAEDIVAVNAGGGRPFREGWAARYNASPIFRKMIRDLSWFWCIPGLLVASACTVVVVIHPVPKEVAYGIGWGVPFVWAGIWGFITLPWVKSSMRKERVGWEEDAAIVADTKQAPPPVAPGPVPGHMADKVSESSTFRGSTLGSESNERTVV